MNKYKELFERWNKVCGGMQKLSAYVQNDLDRLLDEGHVSKEIILKSVIEFDTLFQKNKQEQEKLFFEIKSFLLAKATNNNRTK